jgi:hypothetical protein
MLKLPMPYRRAVEIAGNLSEPSKMPGYGYSVPASACQTGRRLAKTAGTTCSKCYALKGNYAFPRVQAALHRRLDAMRNHPEWVEAMVTLITVRCLILDDKSYFRWFDSGDLQSVENLRNIVTIAERLPEIQFWLPTRELKILQAYVRQHGAQWPQNLTIRYSASLINRKPDRRILKELNIVGSGVTDTAEDASCPASTVHKAAYGSNTCGPCRKCWDRSEPIVTYPLH